MAFTTKQEIEQLIENTLADIIAIQESKPNQSHNPTFDLSKHMHSKTRRKPSDLHQREAFKSSEDHPRVRVLN